MERLRYINPEMPQLCLDNPRARNLFGLTGFRSSLAWFDG